MFTTKSILLSLVRNKYIGKPHSKMLLKRRFVPKEIVATLNVLGYDYYQQKSCILMLYFSFNMLYISEARLATVGHPASAMELFGTIHSFFL